MVLSQIRIFPIFWKEMIRCQTWNLERLIVAGPQYDQIQQASPTWPGGKQFRKTVKFRQFYERPKFEAFFDPFFCEDVADAQQIQASTTYPQEGVNPSLFQSLKQGLLPAGSRDLAKISSTVVAGELVESQLCNERREKIFAEQRDTTLSARQEPSSAWPAQRGVHRAEGGSQTQKAATLRKLMQKA